MLISVKDAAAVLGLKSRGSIYRKIKTKELATVPGSEGPLVEREGLEEQWANITRTRSDSPTPRRRAAGPLRPAAERMAARKPAELPQPADVEPQELPDYNTSRARSEFEKANLLELERKQKEGQLLLRDAVVKAWGDMIAIARAKIIAVPSRAKGLIPHLSTEDVETLRGLIEEALMEVSNADGC